MSSNVLEFEAAVLCAYNVGACNSPRSQAYKGRAREYCDQLKSSPQALVICVELLLHTSHVSVQFSVLGFLVDILADDTRWQQLPLSEREKLRVTLLGWVRSRFATLDSMPLYLRQKIAVVITKLIKRQYLDSWPTAFSDLNSFLDCGPPAIHLWLRVLFYIDEEIVQFNTHRTKEEHAINTRIKDAMRKGPVQQIVRRCREILLTYQSTLPELARECLVTLKCHVDWIDINLVVNTEMLGMLRGSLSQPHLRKVAAECFSRLICKGM